MTGSVSLNQPVISDTSICRQGTCTGSVWLAVLAGLTPMVHDASACIFTRYYKADSVKHFLPKEYLKINFNYYSSLFVSSTERTVHALGEKFDY